MKRKHLINYVREAFALPANLIYLVSLAGIAVVTSVSGVLSVALPFLFLGAGLEMLYLALIPRWPRFIQAVNSRHQGRVERVEQQLVALSYLTKLGKDSIEQYASLTKRRTQISDNLIKQNFGDAFLQSYLTKMNLLEAQYVELLYDIDQATQFLAQESSTGLEQQQRQIELEMQAAGDSPRIRELYAKRLDLLRKRREKNLDVKDQLRMAQIQLATLQDTVNYLQEQSMTLRNPDEVRRLLDSVISETEEHYESMKDIKGILDEESTELHDVSFNRQPGDATRTRS
jgi:hypothetical protein